MALSFFIVDSSQQLFHGKQLTRVFSSIQQNQTYPYVFFHKWRRRLIGWGVECASPTTWNMLNDLIWLIVVGDLILNKHKPLAFYSWLTIIFSLYLIYVFKSIFIKTRTKDIMKANSSLRPSAKTKCSDWSWLVLFVKIIHGEPLNILH